MTTPAISEGTHSSPFIKEYTAFGTEIDLTAEVGGGGRLARLIVMKQAGDLAVLNGAGLDCSVTGLPQWARVEVQAYKIKATQTASLIVFW